jgi:chromosome segregation ATPase
MSNDKITFRVDSDTKRRLDSGHVNKSAVMRDLAEKYARTGDTEEAALIVEREQKEDRIRELKRDKSDIQAEIDRLEREVDRIDTRLEQTRENISDEAQELAEKISNGNFRGELSEDNLAVVNQAHNAGLDVENFIFEVQQELSK